MIEVEAPDGSIVEFPDGTDRSVMTAAMAKRFPARQAATPAYDSNWDLAKDYARAVGQGATLGFGDEIVAGVRSALPEFAGGADYDTALEDERGGLARIREHNPGTALAAEIGGGLLLPGGGLAVGAARNFVRGNQILHGAATGAGFGAAYGFGSGEGGASERVLNAGKGAAGGVLGGAVLGTGIAAFDRVRAVAHFPRTMAYADAARRTGGLDELTGSIAADGIGRQSGGNVRAFDVLGEEMTRHGGGAPAIEAATTRLAAERGITANTARGHINSLQRAHADSNLLLGEYPSIATAERARFGPGGGRLQPQNVDEAALRTIEARPSQQMFDYLANSGTGESASMARNAVTGRNDNLRQGMDMTIQRMSPQGQTIEGLDALQNTVRQQAAAEYAAVHGDPTAINLRGLHADLAHVVRRHMRRMRWRGGDHARALNGAIDELTLVDRNGRRSLSPSLQQLQDMRGAIRGQMQAAVRGGRDDIANTLQPLYTDLTRIMERASPRWAQTNRRWADLRIGETARELGQELSERAGPRYREQLREFADYAPEMQDMVRIEFLQKLRDKIGNLKDGAQGGGQDVSKLFDTQHIRDTVRALFGDEHANAFIRAVRDQKLASGTRNMIGNSRTHVRGMVQQEMDGDLDALAAARNLSVPGLLDSLFSNTVGRIREARNRYYADLITTPMNNVPVVAQRVHQMRQAEQQVQRSQVRHDAGRPARYLGQYAGQYSGERRR
jgi:hypothetical protein